MVNNKEQIIKLLEFETKDDFYYLQVLQRKKENPEIGSKSYLVKSYQITSIKNMERKMSEIINLCEFHNARAYINLNRRSFRKVAFELNLKIANQFKNQDYLSVRKSYDSVCGTSEGMNQKNRRWVVDIDTHDVETIKEISEFINSIQPVSRDGDATRIICSLKTLNGIHLITNSFRLDTFKQKYPDVDVQRNNPTLLYIS